MPLLLADSGKKQGRWRDGKQRANKHHLMLAACSLESFAAFRTLAKRALRVLRFTRRATNEIG